MERKLGGEIRADDDRHIHEAKRIGLELGLALLQCPGYSPSRVNVTPPRQHPRPFARFASVADRHHVDSARTQQPGDINCQSLAVGAVEHLDRDAVARARHRPRELPGLRGFQRGTGAAGTGPQHQRRDCQGSYQRGCGDDVASAFQKRTVGSSSAQPEFTV